MSKIAVLWLFIFTSPMSFGATQKGESFCETLLAGRAPAPINNHTQSWRGLYEPYKTESKSPLNEFERVAIPNYMTGELKFTEVIDSLVQNELFRENELKRRLTYEFSNPLRNLSDIQQRQADLRAFGSDPKLLNAFKNLKRALHSLDLFSMAVYNDPQFEGEGYYTGVGTMLMTNGHRYYNEDGAYFWQLANLGTSNSSYFDRHFPEMPPVVGGLGILFAPPATLRNLLRFNNQHLAELEPARRAFAEFAEVLREHPSPLFQKLAFVFSTAANPNVEIQQDPLTFWQRLSPKARRLRRFEGLQFQSQGRASVLLATLMAIDEINVLNFMNDLVVKGAGSFCLPEFLPRKTPRIEINEFHHPYWWHRNASQSVANSVNLDGEGREAAKILLLQGPQRRGKSTFKEGIVWAELMARTGYVVMAKSMKTTLIEPITLFNTGANYANSDSMFSSQARAGNKILERLAQDANPIIFLIDEAYGGTTSKQQLAILQAWLEQASKYNQVGILTTQNPNIVSFNIPGVRIIHNRDDYTIAYGPSPAEDQNAPEVLEEVGHSPEFVSRVRQIMATQPRRQR